MVCLPKHCKKKPRYSDGAIVHLYCSRTCANLAKGRAPANGNTSVPTSPVKARNPWVTAVNPSNASTPGNTTNRLSTVSSTNTRSGLVSTKRGVTVPTSPRNSVISMNPRDSISSMNPRYSIASTSPRDSTTSMNSSITLKNRSFVYHKGYSVPICKTPGCSLPVYVDRHGVASEYCTRTHQQYVFQLNLVS